MPVGLRAGDADADVSKWRNFCHPASEFRTPFGPCDRKPMQINTERLLDLTRAANRFLQREFNGLAQVGMVLTA